MARRRQRILSKSGNSEGGSDAVGDGSDGGEGDGEGEERKEEEEEAGEGKEECMLDDILEDMFVNVQKDDGEGAGGGGKGGDDGEPVMPSEQEAAEKEANREARKASSMKRYREMRFKKKKKKEGEEEEEPTSRAEEPTSRAEEEAWVQPAESNDLNQSSSEPMKFKGVAAVRRKKAKEAAAAAEALKSSASNSPSSSDLSKKKKLSDSLSLKVSSTFMYIELALIIALIASGYLIGCSSVSASEGSMIRAHTNGNLVGAFDADLDDGIDESMSTMLKMKERLSSASAESPPIAAANIDPIFGVDFDLLTSSDTILSKLGRVAIYFHRKMLALISIPYNLFVPKTLPIFLSFSLCLRIPAFALFGANGTDGRAEAEDGKKSFKAMARKFFKGIFPKMFLIWDIYQLCIADVLAIFFGLLVALATFGGDSGGHFGVVFDVLHGIGVGSKPEGQAAAEL